jgi:Initiator Replication protein
VVKAVKSKPYVSAIGGVAHWPKWMNFACLHELSPHDLKTVCYLINRCGYNRTGWHMMPVQEVLDYLGPGSNGPAVEESLKNLSTGAYNFLDGGSKVSEGMINWSFRRSIADELSNPKSYGKLDIDVLRQLRTFEAIRLYQVIKERMDSEHKNYWKPTIYELLDKLGRNPKERFDNFRRALEPALKELNRANAFVGELEVEYQRAPGRGRAVCFVTFGFADRVPKKRDSVDLPAYEPEPLPPPPEPTIIDKLLSGELEPPDRGPNFAADAERYFALIENEISRRLDGASSATEHDVRQYCLKIVKNLAITLDAEDHAFRNDAWWRPPADLTGVSQFDGELLDETRKINYGDPPRPAPVRKLEREYRVAHISVSARRQVTHPTGVDPPPLRFHAVPHGESASLCGIIPRRHGFEHAPGVRNNQTNSSAFEYQLLRSEYSGDAVEISFKLRKPKRWVDGEPDQEVTCRYCLQQLKPPRPKLRIRPGFSRPSKIKAAGSVDKTPKLTPSQKRIEAAKVAMATFAARYPPHNPGPLLPVAPARVTAGPVLQPTWFKKKTPPPDDSA